MSNKIRSAITKWIADNHTNPNALAVEAGVAQSGLHRFLVGERQLSLDTLDSIFAVMDRTHTIKVSCTRTRKR